jgi:hypothetical protein
MDWGLVLLLGWGLALLLVTDLAWVMGMGWQRMVGMVKVLAWQAMGWVQQAVRGLMLRLVTGWAQLGMGWGNLMATGWVQQAMGWALLGMVWGRAMVTDLIQQAMDWGCRGTSREQAVTSGALNSLPYVVNGAA